MSVVNSFENVVARSSSGEIRNAPTYRRTFTVRCDNPDTSMVDISNAPGIRYGDPHPHDASCFVTTVDVDADGDSMLIYTVSYSYTRPTNPVISGGVTGEEGLPNQPPDPLVVPQGYWNGSSTLETETMSELPFTVFDRQITMTNGRPVTQGVTVDYANELMTMTGFYSDYLSVRKICESVDCMNSAIWPTYYEDFATDYGTVYDRFSWKIMSVNWSVKQQSSEQQTLYYYEVTVTLQHKNPTVYHKNIHCLQGWPEWAELPDPDPDDFQARQIPGWLPQLASAGFQELIYFADGSSELHPIQVKQIYKNCNDEIIDPNDPPNPDDPNCLEFPVSTDTTEEMPLDIKGRKVIPEDDRPDEWEFNEGEPAIVVPWTEQEEPVDFVKLFGPGPPFPPPPGPLPWPTWDRE